MAEEIPHYHIVDEEKRERADDASGDAVVVADDGVLHGVRQRQQHDEVERIQLRQLPLPEDAEQQDQKNIDDQRSQDFFGDRNGQQKHVTDDLMHVAPRWWIRS